MTIQNATPTGQISVSEPVSLLHHTHSNKKTSRPYFAYKYAISTFDWLAGKYNRNLVMGVVA